MKKPLLCKLWIHDWEPIQGTSMQDLRANVDTSLATDVYLSNPHLLLYKTNQWTAMMVCLKCGKIYSKGVSMFMKAYDRAVLKQTKAADRRNQANELWGKHNNI